MTDLKPDHNDIFQRVLEAHSRIHNDVFNTDILEVDGLFFKMENKQKTGSFKARGSLNKILIEKETGVNEVITASTGNHALGVANALKQAGMKGKIVLPENAAQAKVQKLKNYPVELIFVKGTSLEAELHGKQLAKSLNLTWVSPYNDLDIIAGQGTIGVEIENFCKSKDDISSKEIEASMFDIICITVGGGGLISGIGSYLKTKFPDIEIVGCQPTNSAEMYYSVQKGTITDVAHRDTLSDGSAGGIEPEAITFPICQGLIDRFVLVTEEEIAASIKWIHEQKDEKIEGAAAVSVSAARKLQDAHPEKRILAIICGGNIDAQIFADITTKA